MVSAFMLSPVRAIRLDVDVKHVADEDYSDDDYSE